MVTELQIACNERLVQAQLFFHQGDLDSAFSSLEEAHVLGQKYAVPHTICHFWMLRIALKKRDLNEIFGQLLRIPSGALGSALGVFPAGNTGGSNISAFKRLPIPMHLKKILEKDR